MSDQVHDRVDELLAEAEAASGAALASSADGDEPSLGETAREASDLLESTEPEELLAAVDLDTLPDGSEPETIPEAIARGDPERVDDLKRLLNLAKLADRDADGSLDEAADGLRGAIESAREEADEETGDASEEETAEEDTAPDADDEPTAADAADAAEAERADEEDGESDDLEDRLRSTLSDRVEAFGDDVSGLQERLEEAAASATGDDASDDAGAADEEAVESAAAEAEAADEAEAEAADEAEAEEETTEDDGLLSLGQESDQKGSIGTSDASRHSTMAPPPSDRADMRAVARHSTMPDKD